MKALKGFLLCVNLPLLLQRDGLFTLDVLPQHSYGNIFIIDYSLKLLSLLLYLFLELVSYLSDEKFPLALRTLLQELLVYT